MRLEIQFRHMDRSESLEDMMTERVLQAIDGFAHRHDAHVQVWLISDLNRTNRGTGNFKCEIEVRCGRKKDYFISKVDADMHIAIQAATDRLKDLLDEAGKREVDYRGTPSARLVAEMGSLPNDGIRGMADDFADDVTGDVAPDVTAGA